MSGFLYYLPGKTLVTRDDLAGLGLSYIHAGEGISTVGLSQGRGPDGATGGAVFAAESQVQSGEVGYHANRQTWRQIPGSPVWVGHYTDARPSPEVLSRPEQLSGYWLTLADDRPWLVPTARGLTIYGLDDPAAELTLRYHTRLPSRLDLAADGKWVASGVLPKFHALWELAEGFAAVRYGGQQDAGDRYSGDQAVEAAVLCLQTNYRVGRVELAMLGVLTDDLVSDVLDRLIDGPQLVEYLKKKADRERSKAEPAASSVGSSSSAGPAAEILATPPPGPTPGP